jgi:uncharacterized membrane protein YeaQ/YmgE (transglycosylase-associated protein family)
MSDDPYRLGIGTRVMAGLLGALFLVTLVMMFGEASVFEFISVVAGAVLFVWAAVTGRSPRWLEDVRGRRRPR